MAKGSGMIHPNMATMLGVCPLAITFFCLRSCEGIHIDVKRYQIDIYLSQVITTDALVESDIWRKMVKVAVNRSFNQITVGYTISNLVGN